MGNSDSEEAPEMWDYTPLPFPFPPIFSQGTTFTRTGQDRQLGKLWKHRPDLSCRCCPTIVTAVLEGIMAAIKHFPPQAAPSLHEGIIKAFILFTVSWVQQSKAQE